MKISLTLISTLILSATLSACGNSASTDKIKEVVAPVPLSSLIINDVKIDTGEEAKAGQTVSVHYTGWLYDANAADKHGKQFDSSRTRGTPFNFPLGAGRVIKGWDQGVAGMKVGGQRTLTIPSALGYGSRGAGGSIPPNAVLVFDVELLDVE